ncbi:S8 family serine peptidase [Marinibacterium sp. SX1]|uniref:S8 family serine peptidase n=1 Tax=Marinibacterium sp. SX1 TaxID=3388424 RepID=UPI003D16E246
MTFSLFPKGPLDDLADTGLAQDSDADALAPVDSLPVNLTATDATPALRMALSARTFGTSDASDEDGDEARTVTLSAPAIMGAALTAATSGPSKGATGAVEIGAGLRQALQDALIGAATLAPDKARPDADSRGDYAVTVIPSDDLFPNQWHLDNTGQSGGVDGVDLNVTEVWDDYTGDGVVVGVWDDGVQYTHHDLDDNYDTSLHIVIDGVTHNPLPWRPASAHGTAVAGVIAAENNGEGTVGVAYDATLVGVDMFYDRRLDFEASFYELDNFDVTNHSWGWVTPYADSIYDTNGTGGVDWQSFFGGFFESVETGRGGLGTINLVANGNDRTIGRHGNDSNFNAIPQTIAVGATSHDGYVSYYSTPGANLLISSPSNGADGAGIYTTDRTGIWGYDDGDYTSTFGGTSSATPAAAGVVALMLEANDQLGWRDVQEILALTARHTGSDIGAAPEADELFSWEFNGAETWNGGGLHFSNDYGFGLIDALAAVRLAETWTEQKTSANWEDPVVASSNVNSIIPDNDATGISFTFDTTADFDIEHVGLTLGFSGGYTGDYHIVLISPDGTESVLSISTSDGTAVTEQWFYMSNAFRGETSIGTWTVTIIDEVAGDTGTVTQADLQFFGATADADDVYVYTNEFSLFAGDGSHLLTLVDDNGGTDTLNASAVTAASLVTLGGSAVIDGQTITSVQGIENVYTGDGNDEIYGDAGANVLYGGRGDDIIFGGKGKDTLGDGAGRDILKGQAGADIYDICIDGIKDSINGFYVGKDVIRLADGDLDFADLVFTDIAVGKVRIDYADDFLIVLNSDLGLTSADFDASDFLFA